MQTQQKSSLGWRVEMAQGLYESPFSWSGWAVWEADNELGWSQLSLPVGRWVTLTKFLTPLNLSLLIRKCGGRHVMMLWVL